LLLPLRRRLLLLLLPLWRRRDGAWLLILDSFGEGKQMNGSEDAYEDIQ
jgi:hypothetical protein